VFHYTEKHKKVVIFIIGLHNKPQGGSASVASAAGPFTAKKKKDEQDLFFHSLCRHLQSVAREA
jgi:hypothetical protein